MQQSGQREPLAGGLGGIGGRKSCRGPYAAATNTSMLRCSSRFLPRPLRIRCPPAPSSPYPTTPEPHPLQTLGSHLRSCPLTHPTPAAYRRPPPPLAHCTPGRARGPAIVHQGSVCVPHVNLPRRLRFLPRRFDLRLPPQTQNKAGRLPGGRGVSNPLFFIHA